MKQNQMLLIPEEQAAGVLNMQDCIAAVRKAFVACEKGKMSPGGRIAMALPGNGNAGQWLTAVSTDPPVFGSKFSAVFPGNTARGLPCDQSIISLYSGITGEQLAMIGANRLTCLKTGAAAAAATDLAAAEDACRLGIIGTGAQAYTQLLAIQEVRKLKELRLYNRTREKAVRFAKSLAGIGAYPCNVIVCDTAEECVRGSDILCTTTSSHTPVFDAAALQPGTHINAIGSFTPFMQELPEEAVCQAAFVITEHVDGLWQAAGDVLIPFEQGKFGREKVRGSVGALLTGAIKGRSRREEITLYESVGSCVLDVALALEVYHAVCRHKE
ncbi:ornithine cyclodeaminase family protein [Butyricicoccus sp.]|uniref:ornithine cyclodeaminase family protein n=1 Tax=Butyricicoccus sp. TaxID=2049021 RepID=UPI003F181839